MTDAVSLAQSLLDFVPGLAFLVGAWFLVRAAWLARARRFPWLLAGGALLVFLGGFFKATWKLLYTIGVADVRVLGDAQFALLAFGFLALLLGVIPLARRSRPIEPHLGPILPAMAVWKIPFLAIMTLSSIGAYSLLSYLAFRRGARLAGALFILTVMTFLGMSGMAAGEQTVARQWVEEIVNSSGQIAFAVASCLLHRTYVRAAGG